jgi:hypothetical protein
VRIYVDARYLEQRRAFDLRACCEDCVHFDDDSQGCSLTFPNAEHRSATHAALAEGEPMLFCKTFEME